MKLLNKLNKEKVQSLAVTSTLGLFTSIHFLTQGLSDVVKHTGSVLVSKIDSGYEVDSVSEGFDSLYRERLANLHREKRALQVYTNSLRSKKK